MPAVSALRPPVQLESERRAKKEAVQQVDALAVQLAAKERLTEALRREAEASAQHAAARIAAENALAVTTKELSETARQVGKWQRGDSQCVCMQSGKGMVRTHKRGTTAKALSRTAPGGRHGGSQHACTPEGKRDRMAASTKGGQEQVDV
eukprot:361096-Chlamydomonas_euryale.AAC.2